MIECSERLICISAPNARATGQSPKQTANVISANSASPSETPAMTARLQVGVRSHLQNVQPITLTPILSLRVDQRSGVGQGYIERNPIEDNQCAEKGIGRSHRCHSDGPCGHVDALQGVPTFVIES
jgi:hypothetical protein